MKKFICILLLLLIFIFYSKSYAISLIEEALSHRGKPYIYTAVGPKAFDCSGFVYFCVYEVYGIKLPHSAYEQGYEDSYFKIETIEELQPGDLVFFNTIPDKDLSDHAGIYIGSNQFIHASSSQEKIIISDLSKGYYNEVFSWGRRIEEGYNEPY